MKKLCGFALSSPTAVHGGSYLGVQLAKSASGVEGDIAVHEVEVVVEAAKQTADCTWPHPQRYCADNAGSNTS